MKIELKNVTKKINGKNVLSNISATFEGACIYGLNGKNGCGKTMLLRMIGGLIIPTSGEIVLDGELMGKEISFPKSVGALIEAPAFLNDVTGFKNLQLLASLQNKIDDKRIKEAIEEVGLNPNDKRTYKKYSLGMKQRLGIACAIMERPDLILLDEPINAIDISGVALIRKVLNRYKEEGALIILACHDKEELYTLSDKIVEMEEGRICQIKNVVK